MAGVLELNSAFDMDLESVLPVYSSDEDVAALLTLGECVHIQFELCS